MVRHNSNVQRVGGLGQSGPTGGMPSISSSMEGHQELEDPNSSIIMKAMGPRMLQDQKQSSAYQQLKCQGTSMNIHQSNKIKKSAT